MIKGIYSSASGLISATDIQDIVSNNLANIDTYGFKKDNAITQSFASMLMQRLEGGERYNIGPAGTGVRTSTTYTDLSQGPMKYTGGQHDYAIMGPGFFVVETPQGNRYTRNGVFAPDEEGNLINGDGHRLLARDWNPVSAADAHPENILVVDFPEPQNLGKEGYTLWNESEESGEAQEVPGAVQRGYLEEANVSAIGEMTRMIRAVRLYEAGQKAVQVQDETLGRAVNDVGRTT